MVAALAITASVFLCQGAVSSAENTYFEPVYHLANSPGVGQQVTLTKIDLIK